MHPEDTVQVDDKDDTLQFDIPQRKQRMTMKKMEGWSG